MTSAYVFFALSIMILAGQFTAKFALFSNDRWIKSDSLYHLTIAREIRRQGKLPAKIERFLLHEDYSYPPLFHRLLSLIPEKKQWESQLLGPVSDTLIGFAILAFVVQTFGWTLAIISIVVYSLSPYSLTSYLGAVPEPLANLFLVVSMFSSFLFLFTSGILTEFALGIISTVCMCAVFLTHRSTTQSLIAILISEFLGTRSILFLVFPVIGAILALSILGQRETRNVKDHLKFIVFSAKYHFRLYSHLLRNRNFVQAIKEIWNPMSVALNFPIIFLIPLFYANLNSELYLLLVLWALGSIVIYLCWIVGFGYRHLGSAVPALSILVAINTRSEPVVLASVLVVMALVFLMKYYYLFRKETMLVNSDYMDACNFLTHHTAPEDLVMSLPLGESYNLLFFTRCRILQGSGGCADGASFNFELHKRVDGKQDISEVISQFQPNYILTSKEQPIQGIGETVYENVSYKILQIGQKS